MFREEGVIVSDDDGGAIHVARVMLAPHLSLFATEYRETQLKLCLKCNRTAAEPMEHPVLLADISSMWWKVMFMFMPPLCGVRYESPSHLSLPFLFR